MLCAVYGPSDVRMSKELPHRAAVDVLYRPKVTGTGNAAAMLAAGIMGEFYYIKKYRIFNKQSIVKLILHFCISCQTPLLKNEL